MAHQLKMRVAEQVADVFFGTGEEVIEAYDIVAIVQQALAQVRTQEAGTAGNEGTGAGTIVFHQVSPSPLRPNNPTF